jgi:hypothetical protein
MREILKLNFKKKINFIVRTILTIVFFSSVICSCSEDDNQLADSTNSVYNIKTVDNYQNKGGKTTK